MTRYDKIIRLLLSDTLMDNMFLYLWGGPFRLVKPSWIYIYIYMFSTKIYIIYILVCHIFLLRT